MRVVVTGASGFIGLAVIDELQVRGHEPIAVDDLAGINILDERLRTVMKGSDAVIHLAGVLGTEELFGRIDDAIDVNIKGTARVLQACGDFALRYVGITMPRIWNNVYQVTKQASMGLADAWHRHYGVPVSHVRAFNAFGPRQKVVGVRKIIPTFSVLAWRNEPITIWGDGTQIVDLIYVNDVARMLVDSLAFGKGEVFDAGTGTPKSVNEIAQMVLDFTGSTAGVTHGPMRKGEHGTSVVAQGEGWKELGWKPRFAASELEATIEWYRALA